MKERGMIFNGEMVRAILDGRKTQTRRPVKFPVHDKNLGCELAGNELAGELSAGNYLNSAFGKPGDRIWVRETWQAIHDYCDENGHVDERRYARSIPRHRGNYWHPVYEEAWGNESREDREFPWRPSIHMPRWASRILLEITNVGVQRLQDISSGDAVREGICQLPASGRYCLSPGDQYFGGASHSAKEVYSWLWSSIYGEESWKANPWVWVIEFKRVEGGAA
ncbi:TPA: morphogenetic protein [Klebsiella michiganensis]